VRELRVVALIVAVAGCADDADTTSRSVLIVTLDTTRADAVGKGKGTPAIERFLEEATRYAGARTPVPLTLPAHLTLFSGLDPVHHGIHENLAPRLPRERGFPLLAEEFRRAGYATAAFVASAVVGRDTGLDAGFDTFQNPSFGGFWSGEQGDLLASDRVTGALAWLARRPSDRPFFLWVHFFDPHTPYLPFAGDAERAGTRATDPVPARYAGEVRRVDAALARLLDAVPRETIVVLVSDHGEALGEHGEPTHGVLCHGVTVDLFLAVRAREVAAGAVERSVRSLADVAPTLRRWCGLASQPCDGTPLFAAPRPFVVSESLLTYRKYGWGQVFAATDGHFALVENGPRVEIFDLRDDPGELRPLDPLGHEAYERLDRALNAYRSAPRGNEPDGAYFSAGSPYGHAVRPLSGYLPRPENAKLADPAQGFGLRRKLDEAKRLIHRGRAQRDAEALQRAIRLLRGLVEADPPNPAPHLYLVHAQGRLGWLREDPALHRAAARSARAAIERGYRVAPLLYDLLYESLHAGRADDLRAALAIALDGGIHPDLHCAKLVAEAARALGDEAGLAAGRKFLERWSPRMPEEDRAQVAELLASLK
jgi:arylsulfatase A-like enzyme